MKTFTFALVIFLFQTIGCDWSTTSISKDAKISEITKVSRNSQINSEVSKNFDFTKIKTKSPLVWIGKLNFSNGEFDINYYRWANNDLDDLLDNSETGTKIKVDILNCAGYLGSGEIFYKKKIEDVVPEWEILINPDSLAKSAVDKIKQCDNVNDPTSESILSDVFAIAPLNLKRKSIEIGKVDTKKLFSTLPAETKKWLNSKFAIKGGRNANDLSIQQDNWTDTDGDGTIDLLSLTAAHNEEIDTTTRIMLLVKSVWINIGNVQML